MQTKKILMTGADGYVGSHVAAALKTRPIEIHVVTRNESGAGAARTLGLTPHTIALEDTGALRAVASEMGGIAPLAASDNPAFLPVNRAAIEAMMSRLPAGSAFVMHGGSMVCGGRGARIPNALVAAAQRAGYSGFIGDGAAIWSAVHIVDWADLIVRVLLDGTTSGEPVFAAAQQLSMGEAAALVAAAFTPALPQRSVPLDVGMDLWSFFAPGFAVNQNFDARSARAIYGWNPEPRNIAAEFAGLARQLGG